MDRLLKYGLAFVAKPGLDAASSVLCWHPYPWYFLSLPSNKLACHIFWSGASYTEQETPSVTGIISRSAENFRGEKRKKEKHNRKIQNLFIYNLLIGIEHWAEIYHKKGDANFFSIFFLLTTKVRGVKKNYHWHFLITWILLFFICFFFLFFFFKFHFFLSGFLYILIS